MSAVEGSLGTAMLRCIGTISESQKRLSALTPQQHERLLEDTHEILEDVRISLCNMLSLLVTAPITGRMFLPLPADSLSDQTIEASLCAQLGDVH
jgi:hypothetical protein